MYVCVCMYICMYVYVCICMDVCMYDRSVLVPRALFGRLIGDLLVEMEHTAHSSIPVVLLIWSHLPPEPNFTSIAWSTSTRDLPRYPLLQDRRCLGMGYICLSLRGSRGWCVREAPQSKPESAILSVFSSDRRVACLCVGSSSSLHLPPPPRSSYSSPHGDSAHNRGRPTHTSQALGGRKDQTRAAAATREREREHLVSAEIP